MNKKDNQRTRLTKTLLKQSYLRLMHETPVSKITVKDICVGAEVNRSTFYLHYSEPNDILMELEDETISQISEVLNAIGASEKSPSDAHKYLMTFLNCLKKNDELFTALLVENNDPHFRKKFQAIALNMAENAFNIDIPASSKRSSYLFIVTGSIELLTEWIRNKYDIPDQTMCDILYRLCEGSIKNICTIGDGN